MKKARCVVFYSGGASALGYLADHDPNYGVTYEVVGAFSDKPDAKGHALATKLGVPFKVLDFKEWRRANDVGPNDLVGRIPYFAKVCELIREWEADFIICAGFMMIVTNTLLSEYEGRILNVHPADLRIPDPEGKPLYRGVGVVRRAMVDGAPTSSTVHLLTTEVDGGPIVAVSEPLPYKPGDDAEQHQQLMKDACDGPGYVEAIARLLNAGWPEIPWRE